MKTFQINGKTYNAVPFDFNMIVNLEDCGVVITDSKRKPMSLVRAYLATCMGASVEDAGNEIGQHIINGGDLSEVMEVIGSEMEESDFFRALPKTATESNPKAKKSK